jgi:hypothetical protein
MVGWVRLGGLRGMKLIGTWLGFGRLLVDIRAMSVLGMGKESFLYLFYGWMKGVFTCLVKCKMDLRDFSNMKLYTIKCNMGMCMSYSVTT